MFILVCYIPSGRVRSQPLPGQSLPMTSTTTWQPVPMTISTTWQPPPHDNHQHALYNQHLSPLPCFILQENHHHMTITTTWQSLPHDNHHHMTITTTYLQMSPRYNCVRPGDSFIWFDLYRYSLSKPTIVVISKEYWKVFITFIIV